MNVNQACGYMNAVSATIAQEGMYDALYAATSGLDNDIIELFKDGFIKAMKEKIMANESENKPEW